MQLYLGPPWTDSHPIWAVDVFHHAPPIHGIQNTEIKKKFFVTSSLLYSIYISISKYDSCQAKSCGVLVTMLATNKSDFISNPCKFTFKNFLNHPSYGHFELFDVVCAFPQCLFNFTHIVPWQMTQRYFNQFYSPNMVHKRSHWFLLLHLWIIRTDYQEPLAQEWTHMPAWLLEICSDLWPLLVIDE